MHADAWHRERAIFRRACRSPILSAGLAVDQAGFEFFSSSFSGYFGISRYSGSNTTPDFTFGGGFITTPGALAFGPDGFLYMIDSGLGKVLGFNTNDGSLQNSFSLADAANEATLVIGPDGRVYTANGNGGGYVYDSGTGATLGAYGADNPQYDSPARAAMMMDSNGYLYVTDQTGVYVFNTDGPTSTPEPSSLLLIGTALAAGVTWRRRHRH
ncbi:MAG: PEP-CTERM sorting domain-containing protein [Gemmatimonadota bacterium]